MWPGRVEVMKVAFLIHSMEASSSRYRVVQYLPFLREQGMDVSVHFYKRGWRNKLTFYHTLHQYDLVYILRKLFSPRRVLVDPEEGKEDRL